MKTGDFIPVAGLFSGGQPNKMNGGVSQEPLQGDSLTQYVRSLQNLTATQGQSTLQSGGAQYGAGITAAGPALDFLTKLVRGDQADVQEAAAPQIDQIRDAFAQARNMLALQPRGGGKTSALAEAPFQEAAATQRTEGAMRAGAADQLGGLATRLASLGLSEQGLGAGLEEAGQQAALARRGQDMNTTFASQFNQVASGINQLI